MVSSYNNQVNSQNILNVRHQRRLRLCQMLTVIGCPFLLIFGLFSLIDESYLLSGILLGCLYLGLLNLYFLYKQANIERAVLVLNAILFVLSLTLLITGGKDNTGILWIYPIVAINLFINRFWSAIYLYGFFLVLSGLLLFTPLSSLLQTSYSASEALRFEISLLALWAICLAALRSEENSHDVVVKLHSEDIHKLAYFDSLTGLPNRWNFQINLERLLRRSSMPQRVGLLYIDLDNFKQVNDNYGHKVGDSLLLSFSERLSELVRPTDLIATGQLNEVARLAGDEFVVILPELNNSIDAGSVAHRILKLFDDGFELDGITHPVYASIGISIFPDDAISPAVLLQNADAAMYAAKRSGNNCMQFYTGKIAQAMLERQNIETGLKESLISNQLSLLYMPIFDSQNLDVVAVEVLLRCQHSFLSGIGPDRFIPVAESTGLIKEIDIWVLDKALADFVGFQKDHHYLGKLCVNVSGIELLNEDFPYILEALLEKYAVTPSTVELEITETALIQDNKRVTLVLKQLHHLGVSIALDDFGTGYTAFNQLVHYPADCLKIDRSFVSDLFSDDEARKKMVRIMQNLAKIYNLRVVAEGVETKEQLDYLQKIGCDWIQGYLLSRPLRKDDFCQFLKDRSINT